MAIFRPEPIGYRVAHRLSAMRKNNRECKRGRKGGYLLLEVLLALAILSIVVVMIFQIVQTTLRVTSDINFLETQQQKVDGICELLRRNFIAMPQTTHFQTRKKEKSFELIFRDAPFSFSWSGTGAQYGTVVIAGRPQSDGRTVLSVLQDPGDASRRVVDAQTEWKGNWVPLLSDIDQIGWRFFDSQNGKWLTEWPDAGAKPALIEITLKVAGRNHLERGVFRWPVAQINPSIMKQ
jgi:type II secretory pathway component PulJ